jgi:GT2 family glycosyltransferase
VQKAIAGINAEVFVVDNASTDGSRFYLEPKFPDIHFIWNKENIGFGKGCNQALKLAKGEVVLFLNPDTIVAEDCFTACVSFLENTKDAGALGIRMLDGRGNFLPESKRSFPSPLTSFYKLSGLSFLFPKSKTFGCYHLGYLDEHQNHEVDVLAGAFMMIKKEVLDKTGGFDENFFMYGEDVDLSYRIQQTACNATGGNYKNYYFSERSILHFKGESTKKGSVNYVRMFYIAMSRFVKKHYSSSSAGLFAILINTAIWMRAFLSIVKRFIQKIGLPVLDALLIFLSFWLAKFIWVSYVRTEIIYQQQLLLLSFTGFTFLFLIVSYYTGLYEKQFKYKNLWQSTLISMLIILAAYSLLPERFRFSRGIVLAGSVFSYLILIVWRWLLLITDVIQKADNENEYFSVVAGTHEDLNTINGLLNNSGRHKHIEGFVSPLNEVHTLGNLTSIQTLLKNTPVKELIVCESPYISFAEIISLYEQNGKKVKLRLHANGSASIVGSDSKNEAGQVLNSHSYQLSQSVNLRLKRLIDVITSFILFILFPIHFLINKHPVTLLKHCIEVLLSQKTWIGYTLQHPHLPKLKPSVLGAAAVPHSQNQLNAEALLLANEWYAREYEPLYDLRSIVFNYQKLGIS